MTMHTHLMIMVFGTGKATIVIVITFTIGIGFGIGITIRHCYHDTTVRYVASLFVNRHRIALSLTLHTRTHLDTATIYLSLRRTAWLV